MKKYKNKKSLIAIVVFLGIGLIGLTFAYFQTSGDFVNLFNTGTYQVVTTEVFEAPTNWAPGEEIPKTITSTNEGTITAAVRVKYQEKFEDLEGNDITEQVTSNPVIVNLDNTDDWEKDGDYYYYKYPLEANKTTSSFIKSVTLDSELNGIQCTESQDGSSQTCRSTNNTVGKVYKLIITKETVQYNKYKTIWNTNVDIKKKALFTTQLQQTPGETRRGDEVCIQTECFVIVDQNEDTTTLLAKYNVILLGFATAPGSVEGLQYDYPTLTAPYPDDPETSTSEYWRHKGFAGTIFSEKDYWIENNTVKQQYLDNPLSTTNHPYVYDDTYDHEPTYEVASSKNSYVEFRINANPGINDLITVNAQSTWDETLQDWVYPPIGTSNDENYGIAYYVKDYKSRLQAMGLKVNKARLLSYDEFGTDIVKDKQAFWLGSLNENNEVLYAYEKRLFGAKNGNDQEYRVFYWGMPDRGVRPVIEIPTDELG